MCYGMWHDTWYGMWYGLKATLVTGQLHAVSIGSANHEGANTIFQQQMQLDYPGHTTSGV